MKINEQLELHLECKNPESLQARRNSNLMVKPEWWFARLRHAVESAPEWEPSPNRLPKTNRAETIRHKLVR